MSRTKRIWSYILISVICLSVSGIAFGSLKLNKKQERSTQKQEKQIAESTQHTDHWIIRDAYARLMRYHTAEREEKSYTSKIPFSADDYIEYAINDLRSGSIEDILNVSVTDLVTERRGDVLNITANYKNPAGGPTHVSYAIDWEQALDIKESRGRLIVQNLLPSVNEKYSGVVRYTAYDVTVLLGGKQRSYKALAFHFSSRKGNRKSQTIILDNISPNLNTVLEERYPQIREPWDKYIASEEYLAISNEENKMQLMNELQMSDELTIGYLAGDEPRTLFASASTCEPVADAQWSLGSVKWSRPTTYPGDETNVDLEISISWTANMPVKAMVTADIAITSTGGNMNWDWANQKVYELTSGSTIAGNTVLKVPGHVLLGATGIPQEGVELTATVTLTPGTGTTMGPSSTGNTEKPLTVLPVKP